MGLARRCAEEHRQQGPVRLAHAREVQAGGSRLRPCSERGPPRGQARWCGASPWSVRPVATQGAALGSSKPGRGDAVATPSTRGRGDGGRRCSGGGEVKCHGVVRVDGRALPPTPIATRWTSRSFGFAVFANGIGLPRPTPTRTVWLPSGTSTWAPSVRASTVDGPRSGGRGRERRAAPGARPIGASRTMRRWPRVCSVRPLHVAWTLGSAGEGGPVRLSSRHRAVPAGFGRLGPAAATGQFLAKRHVSRERWQHRERTC